MCRANPSSTDARAPWLTWESRESHRGCETRRIKSSWATRSDAAGRSHGHQLTTLLNSTWSIGRARVGAAQPAVRWRPRWIKPRRRRRRRRTRSVDRTESLGGATALARAEPTDRSAKACGWTSRPSVLTSANTASSSARAPATLPIEVRTERTLADFLGCLRCSGTLLHHLVDGESLAEQPLALRCLDRGSPDLLVANHDDGEALQLASRRIGDQDGVLDGCKRREDLANLRNCHARIEIPHIDLEHRHGAHSQPHLEELRDSTPIGRGLDGPSSRTRGPKRRPYTVSRQDGNTRTRISGAQDCARVYAESTTSGTARLL